MSPDDMFLKVEFTAYFPVEGLKIERKEFPNDSDLTGIYLKGKRIMPDLYYYLVAEDGSLKDLPKSMQMPDDSASWREEFITREQMWKDDPDSKIWDEILERDKVVEKKSKP